MTDCLFCKIAHHQLPSDTLYEDHKVIVFMSLENHPLVVPKKHFTDLYELDDEYAAAIMHVAIKISNAVKAATNCDGLNLIQSNGKVAGQDVFHFHLHIKPRFENDDVTLTWGVKAKADDARSRLCENIKLHLSQQSTECR